MLASLSRLQAIDKLQKYNTAFGLLEAGTRVADVPRSFGRNERTIYRLQTRLRQSGSKNDKPRSLRPRITTPLEVRDIVTST